jgi:hypothetical protein
MDVHKAASPALRHRPPSRTHPGAQAPYGVHAFVVDRHDDKSGSPVDSPRGDGRFATRGAGGKLEGNPRSRSWFAGLHERASGVFRSFSGSSTSRTGEEEEQTSHEDFDGIVIDMPDDPHADPAWPDNRFAARFGADPSSRDYLPEYDRASQLLEQPGHRRDAEARDVPIADNPDVQLAASILEAVNSRKHDDWTEFEKIRRAGAYRITRPHDEFTAMVEIIQRKFPNLISDTTRQLEKNYKTELTALKDYYTKEGERHDHAANAWTFLSGAVNNLISFQIGGMIAATGVPYVALVAILVNAVMWTLAAPVCDKLRAVNVTNPYFDRFQEFGIWKSREARDRRRMERGLAPKTYSFTLDAGTPRARLCNLTAAEIVKLYPTVYPRILLSEHFVYNTYVLSGIATHVLARFFMPGYLGASLWGMRVLMRIPPGALAGGSTALLMIMFRKIFMRDSILGKANGGREVVTETLAIHRLRAEYLESYIKDLESLRTLLAAEILDREELAFKIELESVIVEMKETLRLSRAKSGYFSALLFEYGTMFQSKRIEKSDDQDQLKGSGKRVDTLCAFGGKFFCQMPLALTDTPTEPLLASPNPVVVGFVILYRAMVLIWPGFVTRFDIPRVFRIAYGDYRGRRDAANDASARETLAKRVFEQIRQENRELHDYLSGVQGGAGASMPAPESVPGLLALYESTRTSAETSEEDSQAGELFPYPARASSHFSDVSDDTDDFDEPDLRLVQRALDRMVRPENRERLAASGERIAALAEDGRPLTGAQRRQARRDFEQTLEEMDVEADIPADPPSTGKPSKPGRKKYATTDVSRIFSDAARVSRRRGDRDSDSDSSEAGSGSGGDNSDVLSGSDSDSSDTRIGDSPSARARYGRAASGGGRNSDTESSDPRTGHDDTSSSDSRVGSEVRLDESRQ